MSDLPAGLPEFPPNAETADPKPADADFANARSADEAAVHPNLAPLALLFGTWLGEGRATYPTMDEVDYGEQTVLAPVPGRPLCWYEQRTWALADGRPLHDETGWWRVYPDGQLELLVAAAPGFAEVATGTVSVDRGTSRVETTSVSVVPTPTGPDASRVRRSIAGDGTTLRYELHLEAVGQPLGIHLVATLRRADPGASGADAAASGADAGASALDQTASVAESA